MVRFIHLADLHLGAYPKYLNEFAQQRFEDYLLAFERVVDYAIKPESEIDFVIIAGDFFDSVKPPQDVIKFAIMQFKRLKSAKIPVVLTPGNHDNISDPRCVYLDQDYAIKSLVNLIENPNIRHTFTLNVKGENVNIYGMAWDVQKSKPPFDRFTREIIDGYHITVVHGNLLGSQFSEAHSREIPLDLKNLSDTDMDYIALGHIHSYQNKKAGSIPVVIPGTLESRRFANGELGDRYLVTVTLDKGKQPIIEKIKWNIRTYQSYELDVGKTFIGSQDELCQFISKEFQGSNNATKIKLIGDTPVVFDIEKVITRLSGDFFTLIIEDCTEVFNNETIESWSKEDTVRGLYIRNLKKLYDKEKSDDMKRVMNMALKLAVKSFEQS